METMFSCVIATPIGNLRIETSDAAVRCIGFCGCDPCALPLDAPHILKSTVCELNEYFSGGRKSFTVKCQPIGTEFQLLAWNALLNIPYGETATYSQQAESIGRPKAVRAVGGANHNNPIAIIFPCHRVIGKNGLPTGYAGGLAAKEWLLCHEQQNK